MGVADESMELGEGVGAEPFDPADAGARVDGGLVEVDEQDDALPVLSRIGGSGQQRLHVLGSGEPGEGFGAELVRAEVGVLRTLAQGVGDVLDGAQEAAGVAGGDPAVDGLQACVVWTGGADVALASFLLDPSVVGVPVGLDHLGGREVEHPGGGLAGDGVGDGAVDYLDLRVGEAPGHRGDLAGNPDLGLEVTDQGPDVRKSVAQIEGVGDGRPDGMGVHLAGDTELDQRELCDSGRALATEVAELLAAGPAFGGDRCVEIAVVQHQLQVVDLDLSPAADQQSGAGPGWRRRRGPRGPNACRESIEQMFE